MLAKRTGRGDRFVADQVEAARATLRDHASPMIVAYHPAVTSNPYQGLLYSSAAELGAATIPVRRLADLGSTPAAGDIVCHLHWLSGVVGPAGSDREARARIREFTRLLDGLRRRPLRLLWTAHNCLPHDARRPDLEIALRQEVISRVDAIHVMTEQSFEETRALYELPRDRTFCCPHPSYEGVYPDRLSRLVARRMLGLSEDDVVFLAFGAIRRYKGLDELAAVFAHLPARSVLVIAGAPTDTELASRLQRELHARDDVRLFFHHIPLERVQVYFRAADYLVCAHRAVLNSGAAMLAVTFGVPVVGPRSGAVGELVTAGAGIGFESGTAASMRHALREATFAAPGRFSADLASLRARLAPRDVSRRFFRELRARLG